jgi:tetratricopeptide (TPR) repeat protein
MAKARCFTTLLLLISLSLLVMAGGESAWAAPPLAGKIVFLQGEVSVRAEGAKEWTPAQLNKELYVGDAVKTGPLSRAAVLCVDESQVKLNENTILVLKQVLPSPRLRVGAAPAAEKGAFSIYQVPQGEIWLRNKNDKFRFELETPAVTATVRGTEFNLLVKPDGTTSVTLMEGNLCLINPVGEVCLVPGEEGSARPGQVPVKRVLVQPADAVQWVLYYPGIFSYRDLPLSGPEGAPLPQGLSGLASRISQGEAAYDQGKLGEAKEAAEAVLAQDPQNGRALTLLGWVSLQYRAPAEARGYFRRVRQPTEGAVIGEALARCQLGELSGAYELVKSARTPSRSLALLTMQGYFALLVGKAEAARTLLEEAVRQTEAPLPRALLAQIYLVQNRKDAALKEASTALARAPNSPVALLSMALVKMAYFDLPAATGYLQKAVAADPRFVEAYIYLAKIWLGSDYLARAQQTIEPALRLAPRDAVVLSLAGFIRLAYRDFDGAKHYWTRAADADPSLGEPHLGLAIYNFRHRDYGQGLSEMLTATLLDPRVSLYQSELGKALYQARAFDKALEVYDYATTLDPKDPTPHLYKGIALTDLNRPGEAIQEINKSIELNDNVALFRTRLALDRDLAVRNANLARSYQQLGLSEWAFSKAITALKNDPYNSSAHLMLLSGYLPAGGPDFFTPGILVNARNAENTLYRVLSPANQSTYSNLFLGPGNIGLTFDYTPMFEMPYARAVVQGGIGAWEGKKSVTEDLALVYGGWPGAAFLLKGEYSDDRGLAGQGNAFSRTRDFLINAKWSPTVNGTFSGLFEYGEQRFGNLDVPVTLNGFGTENVRRNFAEVAYLHRFTPQFAVLGYYARDMIPDHTYFRFFAPQLGLGNALVNQDLEFNNIQAQSLLVLGQHTFIGGFDSFSSNVSNREDLFGTLITNLYGTNIRLDLRPPWWSYSFYLLDYWKLTPNLIAELGLFKDFIKNPSDFRSGNIYTSQWNPRFGLNYLFQTGQTQHALRLAAFRASAPHFFQPILVPADVAGFPWVIDAGAGSEIRTVGAAWEAQWDPKTFTTLRLEALRLTTPVLDDFNNRSWDQFKRYQAAFTLNRILLPSLGLSLGIKAKRVIPDLSFQPDLQDYSEMDYTLGLSYLHRDGWLAGIKTSLMQQFLKDRNDNLFGLVNLRVGRELPHKRGLITFEVDNLLNRHFTYILEPNRDLEFFPSRMYIFRAALYF